MDLQVQRTPNLIAAEINDIKERTRKLVIYNSIEIGRRLVEAKELVEHGQWGKWLEEEVSYSKSTANNLMKIFREYGADQISLVGDNIKSQAFGELTYSQAVLLLGVPIENREKFIEENKVDEMSTRELKKTIADLKKAEKERDKAKEEVKSILQEKEALESAFNDNALEREKVEKERENLKKEIKELEEKLNSKPVEINVNTEEMELKYQEQLNKLKEKNEKLNKKIEVIEQQSGEDAIRFKAYFDNIVGDFTKLLETLALMKNSNEIQYTKFNAATKKFINTMLERL